MIIITQDKANQCMFTLMCVCICVCVLLQTEREREREKERERERGRCVCKSIEYFVFWFYLPPAEARGSKAPGGFLLKPH